MALSGEKIFCVGNNKTGTTSLKKFMNDLGIVVGEQGRCEDIAFRHLGPMPNDEFWRRISEEVQLAQFFQDIPFSNPVILHGLVERYPSARYIYTMRNPESWYRSLVGHHARAAGFTVNQGSDGSLEVDPLEVVEKLSEWTYRGLSGLDLVNQHFGFDVSKAPYERDCFVEFHRRHLEQARTLLATQNAIFIDIIDDTESAVSRLLSFLSLSPTASSDALAMPHLNRAI